MRTQTSDLSTPEKPITYYFPEALAYTGDKNFFYLVRGFSEQGIMTLRLDALGRTFSVSTRTTTAAIDITDVLRGLNANGITVACTLTASFLDSRGNTYTDIVEVSFIILYGRTLATRRHYSEEVVYLDNCDPFEFVAPADCVVTVGGASHELAQGERLSTLVTDTGDTYAHVAIRQECQDQCQWPWAVSSVTAALAHTVGGQEVTEPFTLTPTATPFVWQATTGAQTLTMKSDSLNTTDPLTAFIRPDGYHRLAAYNGDSFVGFYKFTAQTVLFVPRSDTTLGHYVRVRDGETNIFKVTRLTFGNGVAQVSLTNVSINILEQYNFTYSSEFCNGFRDLSTWLRLHPTLSQRVSGTMTYVEGTCLTTDDGWEIFRNIRCYGSLNYPNEISMQGWFRLRPIHKHAGVQYYEILNDDYTPLSADLSKHYYCRDIAPADLTAGATLPVCFVDDYQIAPAVGGMTVAAESATAYLDIPQCAGFLPDDDSGEKAFIQSLDWASEPGLQEIMLTTGKSIEVGDYDSINSLVELVESDPQFVKGCVCCDGYDPDQCGSGIGYIFRGKTWCEEQVREFDIAIVRPCGIPCETARIAYYNSDGALRHLYGKVMSTKTAADGEEFPVSMIQAQAVQDMKPYNSPVSKFLTDVAEEVAVAFTDIEQDAFPEDLLLAQVTTLNGLPAYVTDAEWISDEETRDFLVTFRLLSY